MIHSMTGFAAKTREIAGGSLHLEIKSVNSRFLDIHFRLAEDLRQVEPGLRELISARFSRGKVECRANFVAGQASAGQLQLNQELLQALTVLDQQVRAAHGVAAPLSVGEILRWPGMLGDGEVDSETLIPLVLEVAKEALEDFAASRAREGAKLAAIILDKAATMREKVAFVAPQIPEAQAAFQEKLRQKLQEAMGSADDERIRQEVVLFAARIDVAEELERLKTHLDEVERVVKQGGNCGKRLDFLMQELNREANTLGSKSVVAAVSATAMELKLLIEQMREQIQNLE